MTPTKAKAIEKEDILDLLTDAETAAVSMAETRNVPAGDEYIDLHNLAAGIQKATSPVAAAANVLPRTGVSAETWLKVVERLKKG